MLGTLLRLLIEAFVTLVTPLLESYMLNDFIINLLFPKFSVAQRLLGGKGFVCFSTYFIGKWHMHQIHIKWPQKKEEQKTKHNSFMTKCFSPFHYKKKVVENIVQEYYCRFLRKEKLFAFEIYTLFMGKCHAYISIFTSNKSNY